jgi:vacuolar-type H+-ATPase subunit F/Vma7
MTAGAQARDDQLVERLRRNGRVVVIGSQTQVVGFALAGARISVAESDDQVRDAWRALDEDVAVVILTEAAAAALGNDRLLGHPPLSVVLPS